MTATNDIKQRLLNIAIGLVRELAQIRQLVEELDNEKREVGYKKDVNYSSST